MNEVGSLNQGSVDSEIVDGVGSLEFFHPEQNSLPCSLLRHLTSAVQEFSETDSVRVVVLKSRTDGPFCAGASLEELTSIRTPQQGKEFFMGFARLILAIKNCPKLVIARVHGKAIGGSVGVIAAADYTLALNSACIKLSELSLGIGPFVIGPCVERRLGLSAFSTLTLDTDWRSAAWAKEHGLFYEIFENLPSLDTALHQLTEKVVKGTPRAIARMKKAFWEGTEHWDKLLEERAALSGELVLSDFTARTLRHAQK